MATTSPRQRRPKKLSAPYRVTRFLIVNIVFSLFPIGLAVFFRSLNNTIEPLRSYTPDILFLGVVMCATALGDLIDDLWRHGTDVIVIWGCLGLILMLMVAASLFGGYRLAEAIGDPSIPFRDNMAPWGIVSAVFAGGFGVGYEIYLALKP